MSEEKDTMIEFKKRKRNGQTLKQVSGDKKICKYINTILLKFNRLTQRLNKEVESKERTDFN